MKQRIGLGVDCIAVMVLRSIVGAQFEFEENVVLKNEGVMKKKELSHFKLFGVFSFFIFCLIICLAL
jgi:hypothetical protein